MAYLGLGGARERGDSLSYYGQISHHCDYGDRFRLNYHQ